MRIHAIELFEFTTHKDCPPIELPDGVTAVVGGNGKGKSSIIEAVAFAAFGKTLRGATMTNADAEIRGPGLVIRRQRKGNKQTLVATVSGVAITGDTPSKIQEQLDACLTSFDVWRRTCVFSSADAAHFSSSTDAERKRFLEAALNVVKFDELLAAAKNELVIAEREFALAAAETSRISALIENQKVLMSGLTKQLETLPEPPDTATLEALQREISDLEAAQTVYSVEYVNMRDAMAAAQAYGKSLQQQISAIRLPDVDCHACKRPFTDDAARSYARAKAEGELTNLKSELNKARNTYASLQLDFNELEKSSYAKRLAAAREQYAVLSAAAQSTALRESMLKSTAEALSEIERLHTEQEASAAALKEADTAVALATQVVTTFSLRGARVLYMQSALDQLQAYTNTYLTALGDVRITIKGQTEKKTGGMSDTISIVCDGPCGKSYDELSGGQRRRVDIALLLALSEMSPAAKGATLFFDEVFDALDFQGQEAAAGLLRAMSEKQKIVVVTHNKDLLKYLSPSLLIDLGD